MLKFCRFSQNILGNININMQISALMSLPHKMIINYKRDRFSYDTVVFLQAKL